MRRTNHLALLLGTVLLVFPACLAFAEPAPEAGSCAEIGAEGRQRPGNDDIFVFLDSSLSMGPKSMAPWATGYMAEARQLLDSLVDCYVKEGDFFLVATFDSQARVAIAKEIHSQRDRATLRMQIQGLEPTRARYYRRQSGGRPGTEATPPTRGKSVSYNRVLGGSWKTDLGEMLKLASTLVQEQTDPAHRQLILFFTDGVHDPPDFSHFPGQVSLDQFFSEVFSADIETGRFKIGVVAVPKSEDGPDAVDPAILELLARIDPEGQRKASGEVDVLAPKGADPAASFVEQLAELLRLRIDLRQPQAVDLGEQTHPRVRETFEVHNDTKLERTIVLSRAYFADRGGREVELEVRPQMLQLPPGQSQSFEVTGDLGSLPIGSILGHVHFEFEDAIVFHPRQVRLGGEHLRWVEKNAWLLRIASVVLLLTAGSGALLWRKAVWVALVWTDGDAVRTSSPKPVSVRQSLKFGALGTGGMQVDGPESRLGEITRESVHGFSVAFDYLFLDVPGDAQEPPKRLNMGVWYPIPGNDGQRVCFRKAYTRKAVERVLERLPREPQRSASGFGPPDAGGGPEVAPTTEWNF